MINTNARSIRPKLNSFVDNFSELELTFSIITETWLADGDALEELTEVLLLKHGLNLYAKNRPLNNTGGSHGGVAIVTRDLCSKFKPYQFDNPEDFEVFAVTGCVQKLEKKLFLVACYIPPNYRVPRAKACMEHVSNMVLDIKSKNNNALICIAGDFNQWKIEEHLADFPDIAEVPTPPTRNNRRIDRTFTNWGEAVQDFACLKPLEADLPGDDGVIPTSDHLVQYTGASFPRRDPVKWEKFTHRPFTDRGAEKFVQALSVQDWTHVLQSVGSNAKARSFQLTIDDLMDHFFPTKTVRRKESDLPWLNETARKKIRRKRAIFKSESRSERWRLARHDLEKYLEKRRQGFLKGQREVMTGPDASRQFFKNVKSYNTAEKPKSFDIRDLEPGKTDAQVAENVATFFNRISQEFKPLQPHEIPSTYHRPLPKLTVEAVIKRLEMCKKPPSMVDGDIFPKLIGRCAPFLAVPLTDIYNEILSTYVWPVNWKIEYVTAIPKKNLPESYADLRNISCTKLVSKVFETFVLQFAMEEVSLKNNQFGGVKGCSTAHMLIEIIQEICSNSEDYRSTTVLSSLDYSKAFNRLSFQHCLRAFKKKGASTPIIRLVATFLTNRTMTVRVGSTWSSPKDVFGGCPQGSILGVFLFNLTTDDLEDDFLAFEQSRLSAQGQETEEDGAAAPAVLDPEPDDSSGTDSEEEQQRHEHRTSTPTRDFTEETIDLSPIGGGVYRHEGLNITFLHNARNHPFEIPPPENRVGTQVLELKPVKIVKYVDDCITCEKLNMGEVEIEFVGGEPVKIRRAVGTQNAILSITSNALDKGMKINESKTGLICVSDALHYRPVVFFQATEDIKVECTPSIKILGYHISDKPGAAAQVQSVIKKMRQRYWVLHHLRRVGFNDAELVKVYKSSILPLADYCDVVYHSQLTDEQDLLLENAQVGALKRIFGFKNSARSLRKLADVKTLRERRVSHCDKFARKCLESDRFSRWFPLKGGRQSARAGDKYLEEFARCDRLKNSPIFFMRRRLNNKPGKSYGQRNREYRED